MLHEYRDPASFLSAIDRSPVTVDQWQHEKLALVMRKARVFFCVPGLAQTVRDALWGPAFDSIQAALSALFAGLRPGARVAIIPDGPYVLAKIAG